MNDRAGSFELPGDMPLRRRFVITTAIDDGPEAGFTKGSGLGLSIVAAIVRSSGGSVTRTRGELIEPVLTARVTDGARHHL